MKLIVTIEFDTEAQVVTRIDAPGFQSPAYLAAVLGLVVDRAEFEANLMRAQFEQQRLQQEAARQHIASAKKQEFDRRLHLG